MIVITSEYLDKSWDLLNANSVLPTQFSEWDDGDAYTLAEIGNLPSKKIVDGVIMLQDDVAKDYQIVIKLKQELESEKASIYQSPNGIKY